MSILDQLKEKPVIEVPKEFYDELDAMAKPDLIGIIIQLSWELQEYDKAQKAVFEKKIIEIN